MAASTTVGIEAQKATTDLATMCKNIVCSTVCALAIGIWAANPLMAQPSLQSTSLNINGDWQKDVTVLAIAPDGTWGVATDSSIDRAIANAIEACKKKYGRLIGCGYQMTAVRAGWSVGIRCGDKNIIVARRTLVQVEQVAINREFELRQVYGPDMSACVRVVTVDPQGTIVAPKVAHLLLSVFNWPARSSR